jgi:hypothetical protein
VVPKLSMDETPRRLHCDFGLRCAGEHGRALHGGLIATSVCGWLRPRSADAILKYWDREVATIKSAVATFMVRGASNATKSLRNTTRSMYSSGDDNPRKTTGDDIRRNSGGDDNPRKAHRRKNLNQNRSLVGNNVLKQCLKREKKKREKGRGQGVKKRKGNVPIC